MLAFFEDRSMTLWLPPYCSDLNPIERFWKHLKEKSLCQSGLFKQMQEVIDSVDKVLAVQNDLPLILTDSYFQKLSANHLSRAPNVLD